MDPLLKLALDAHGGLENWQQVQSILATARISGRLFELKGHPQGLPKTLLRIQAHTPEISFEPYPDSYGIGHFKPDHIWFGRPGLVTEERKNPRDSFNGHTRETKWDQLHRLYFYGYALWNYFTTPFLFANPDFESKEIEPHQEGNETLRRLLVKFPSHVPTHNSEQIFYFNQRGLLVRLDYAPDVLGGVGAAHFCYDHVTVDGFVFPTLRRAISRRPEGLVTSVTSVLIQFTDINIQKNRIEA